MEICSGWSFISSSVRVCNSAEGSLADDECSPQEKRKYGPSRPCNHLELSPPRSRHGSVVAGGVARPDLYPSPGPFGWTGIDLAEWDGRCHTRGARVGDLLVMGAPEFGDDAVARRAVSRVTQPARMGTNRRSDGCDLGDGQRTFTGAGLAVATLVPPLSARPTDAHDIDRCTLATAPSPQTSLVFVNKAYCSNSRTLLPRPSSPC